MRGQGSRESPVGERRCLEAPNSTPRGARGKGCEEKICNLIMLCRFPPLYGNEGFEHACGSNESGGTTRAGWSLVLEDDLSFLFLNTYFNQGGKNIV